MLTKLTHSFITHNSMSLVRKVIFLRPDVVLSASGRIFIYVGMQLYLHRDVFGV